VWLEELIAADGNQALTRFSGLPAVVANSYARKAELYPTPS
jgi:hypothetical protein